MLTCREVARAIAMDELATAAWPRRLAVRVHLLGCRHCRRYAAQMLAIGRAVRALFQPRAAEAQGLERLTEKILRGEPGSSHRSEETGDGPHA